MPEPYGWDTIEQAEELYIIDGLTFDQVAERTGVSVSQLKRWSADSTPTWPERRREYRTAQVSVRRGVMLAKARLIESVIESEDPQKAYAFGALVSSGKIIEAEAAQRTTTVPPPVEAPPLAEIATPQQAVEALQLALQRKIGLMLHSPNEMTLPAIKDVKATMDMIEQLRTKYKPEETVTRKGGLTDEAAEAIRRQILGLNT
jgi:transcriptional regulator with XRE-family HTH domain